MAHTSVLDKSVHLWQNQTNQAIQEAYLSSNQSKRALLRQKRKEQKQRRLVKIIIIVLAAVALFAAAIFIPKLLLDRAKYSGVQGFSIGDKNAPVTVVQFSSYSCGFCRDFSTSREPDFISEYVDPGKVYYRYVNIPANNAPSQLAAKASYCAAIQNGFFEYKDFLYQNSGSPEGYSAGNLVTYADSADLNTSKFQACLESDTYTTAFMDDVQYAQNVGITFTPSFLVNDQLVNAEELIPKVEEFLEQ